VFSRAAEITDAFDRGVLIRSKHGLWLAIPTPAAGKALGGRRITPAGWERRTGLHLRFVYRRSGPSLLVADGARINARGLAAVSRSKTGRGQVTAPIFLLVPQVKLSKRLDLARDAERAHQALPGLIVANWGTGSHDGGQAGLLSLSRAWPQAKPRSGQSPWPQRERAVSDGPGRGSSDRLRQPGAPGPSQRGQDRRRPAARLP